MKKVFFLYIFTCIAFIAATHNIRDTMRFTEKNLQLHNIKIAKDDKGETLFTLADNTYFPNTISHLTDLVLSFNKPATDLLRDDTGNYQIHYASYVYEKDNGVLGDGGAKFFRSIDRVEISTTPKVWLGECNDLGSFTIEFRFKATSVMGTQTIIKRIGYLSGMKNGMEILLSNGRILARFYGIFKNAQSYPVDVFLDRGKRIKPQRWYHFMISYDRISGKIARYLNGNEEEVEYITRTREPFVDTYTPSFRCEDQPLTIIGKDFVGIIDEIRISHREYRDLAKETAIATQRYKTVGEVGRKPVNREGVITSPVYTLPFTGTKIISFDWEEKTPDGTFVWMEMRISDFLFNAHDAIPRWYRIIRGQRGISEKITENGDYLRGKYIQWRAHLIPSPEGKFSPSIKNILIKYENDLPPSPPTGITITSVKNESFTIRWNKNLENDVLGYKIYYGIRSKKYDGVISKINGKRIPSPEHIKGNIIEVEINNDIINENRKADKHKVLHYPLLKNNVLYYVAVSAYDSYKPDTPFNHESALSSEVHARPFPGSEISQ